MEQQKKPVFDYEIREIDNKDIIIVVNTDVETSLTPLMDSVVEEICTLNELKTALVRVIFKEKSDGDWYGYEPVKKLVLIFDSSIATSTSAIETLQEWYEEEAKLERQANLN